MRKIVTVLLLFITLQVAGQSISPENRIVVLGQATIEMPANQVSFSVTIEANDPVNLDKVYTQHRVLERKIVQILKELKIPQNNISYSLLSVGKTFDYEAKKSNIISSQRVVFKLDSVKKYAEVQAKLITAGFSELDSDFTSTQLNKYKKEVLEKAIIVAKEKAQVMATVADRKIKRIVKVADTDESDPAFNNYNTTLEVFTNSNASRERDKDSLTEIPQTISISATVKVIFELE